MVEVEIIMTEDGMIVATVADGMCYVYKCKRPTNFTDIELVLSIKLSLYVGVSVINLIIFLNICAS